MSSGYAVVCFNEENMQEVVQMSWLKGRSECYFPPLNVYNKIIQKECHASVISSWPVFDVTLIKDKFGKF